MVFEGMTKKQWINIGLIMVAVTLLRTAVQPLIPESGPSPFPPSVFVQSGLMPLAFVAYGLIMLGALALVFVLIQEGLPGSRMVKGLTFSLAFGVLWFAYLCEPLPHGTWHLPDVLYYPAVDGATLAVTGLLLGRFVATDSKKKFTLKMNAGTLAALAIPVIFGAGRLVSYSVFHIYSSFGARPFDTLLWCSAMGIWTGAMYLLLRPGLKTRSPLRTAGFFSIVVFGINIFLNDIFMVVPFSAATWGLGIFSLEDLAVRTAVDVLAVAAGVYVYEVARAWMGLDAGSTPAPAV